MIKGVLAAIYIAPETGAAIVGVAEAQLIAGQGIVGDRYFCSLDPQRRSYLPDGELTLIASEDLIRVKAETEIDLLSGQHRRNLVTRGLDLNDLAGRFIEIGPVKILGRGTCDPCDYLEQLTTTGVKSALGGRGGLRGSVVRGGVIRVGAPIRLLEDEVIDTSWEPTMNRVEAKKRAIEEVGELMKKYIEFVDGVKDKPFTPEIREQLSTKGKIIRWLQEGLESGYYES